MPIMTRDLANAAAWDAGNHSMRAAGRTTWNADDYDAAVLEYNRLWPLERDLEELGMTRGEAATEAERVRQRILGT